MSTEVGPVSAGSNLDQFNNDSTSNSEEGKWNVELEVLLLQLICTHVPKGINKNFQMACIIEKLSGVHSKQVLAASIWSHLKKYYDLDLIGTNETAAFPMQVTDYTLPDTGFEIPLAEAEKPVPVPEATIELKPKETKRRDSSQRGKKEASTPDIQEEKSSKRKRSSASDGEKKNTPTAAAPVKRRRNY